MQFGILLNHEYKKEHDLDERVDELIEMTRIARDSGYKLLFGMQHLLSSLATFQAPVLLSRLIPESGDMRLGTGVYLANLEHPIHIAETWATLDRLSGGRVIMGFGAGYRKNEFTSLGIERKTRWGRMVEHMTLTKQLLTGDPVHFHGKHFDIDGEACSMTPIQDPMPMWLGANGEKTVRIAARHADAWIAPPNVKTGWVKGHLQYYKDELEANGIDPATKEYPLIREMYISDTDKSADEEALDFLREEYSEYAKPEYGRDVIYWRTMFDEFREKAFLWGSSETIIERIQEYADAGFDRFIFRVQWGDMPFEMAAQSVKRFAEEVIPHFQPVKA